ncbi:DUF6409 family protein [Streptomyces sp. NPDC127108]|uniref:DUF6409 family protein n=1 Tax=Streptomyces sp. NPDC127108 TaxID=3345361 RepID=UPI00362E400C
MATTRQNLIVKDFPTATLVLAGPWHRAQQLDSRPAIVVGPFGSTTLLVWYFSIGAPEPGDTVQTMFPNELTPLDDTLATMHPDAFRDIVRSVHRGRFAYDDGGALQTAVLRAWLQRSGLAYAAPEARHAHR